MGTDLLRNIIKLPVHFLISECSFESIHRFLIKILFNDDVIQPHKSPDSSGSLCNGPLKAMPEVSGACQLILQTKSQALLLLRTVNFSRAANKLADITL